jgi:MMP 1-O-methyltransferase
MNALFERDWPRIDMIEGWLFKPEAEVLYSLASGCDGAIVEIGSWKGRSSVCLGFGSRNNPRQPFVYCIDPFTGSREHREVDPMVNTWKEFRKNIENCGMDSIIHPMMRTSREAYNNFSGKIGLLFIDGSHEYEDVEFDFLSWRKFVPKGGWICFHDYNWPGPMQVVYEYVNPIQYIVPKNTVGSLLAIQVR